MPRCRPPPKPTPRAFLILLFGPALPGAANPHAARAGAHLTSNDELSDQRSLEFREYATHGEHGAAYGRCRVERLLVEIQIDAQLVQLANEAGQVLAATAPGDPQTSGNDIELAPGGVFEHPVILRALRPALRLTFFARTARVRW